MKKYCTLLLIAPLLASCFAEPDFKWSKHRILDNAYNFKSSKLRNFDISFDYNALEKSKAKVSEVIESKGSKSEITSAANNFYRLDRILNEKFFIIVPLYDGAPSTYGDIYSKALNAINENQIFYNGLFKEAANSSDAVKEFFFDTLDEEEIQKRLQKGEADKEATKIDADLTSISDDFSYYMATTSSYKTDEAFNHGVEVYVDYVEKANQLAKIKGFNNYLDYSYKNLFSRDYTPEDGYQFALNLKNSFVGKDFTDLDSYPEDDGSKDYDKIELLFNKVFNYATNDGAALFDNYAKFMGKKYMNSYNNLWRDGYYYFSSEEDSLGTAYILFDDTIDYQIAFFSKDNQNILSVVHEFGHYFALDNNDKASSESYDILETHSQANEYVFMNYVKNNYGNSFAKAFGDYRFQDDILYLINFSFIIEVENYAYKEVDLTTEKLATFIQNLSDEYKNLNIPETKNYWMYPCIVSSAYYISYATSLLEAMQFYVMDLNDAKKTYLDFSLDESDKTMVDKWTSVGLKSPFSSEACEFVIDYLDTL